MLVRTQRKGSPHALVVGMQTGAATVESSVEFPKKLEVDLPYDPAVPLLGAYPKNPKMPVRKNMRTRCLQQPYLFTRARAWHQPKGPPVDEQIKRLWYIYTMEY